MKCPVCKLQLSQQVPSFCPQCAWDLKNDLTLNTFLSPISEKNFVDYRERLDVAKKNWEYSQNREKEGQTQPGEQGTKPVKGLLNKLVDFLLPKIPPPSASTNGKKSHALISPESVKSSKAYNKMSDQQKTPQKPTQHLREEAVLAKWQKKVGSPKSKQNIPQGETPNKSVPPKLGKPNVAKKEKSKQQKIPQKSTQPQEPKQQSPAQKKVGSPKNKQNIPRGETPNKSVPPKSGKPNVAKKKKSKQQKAPQKYTQQSVSKRKEPVLTKSRQSSTQSQQVPKKKMADELMQNSALQKKVDGVKKGENSGRTDSDSNKELMQTENNRLALELKNAEIEAAKLQLQIEKEKTQRELELEDRKTRGQKEIEREKARIREEERIDREVIKSAEKYRISKVESRLHLGYPPKPGERG